MRYMNEDKHFKVVSISSFLHGSRFCRQPQAGRGDSESNRTVRRRVAVLASEQDIAPALLGRIRADFLRLLRNAAPSAATYPAALDYADLVGGALAEAFRLHLSADTLPDGRMYWNIADRVLRPLLEEDHALVADAAAAVQQQLNEAAGLRLLAQRVTVDEGARRRHPEQDLRR